MVAVVLAFDVGCSAEEGSERPNDSTSEDSSESGSETVDPEVLGDRILTTQARVLAFAKRAGQYQDLPQPVKNAYNRLDQVIKNGEVAPKEYEVATANLLVLQQAIRSGQLQRMVAREKAKTKRQEKKGGSSGGGSDCMSGYSPCLPVRSDLDCDDVVAMGKAPVGVRGSDPYGLDGDNDGVGCE